MPDPFTGGGFLFWCLFWLILGPLIIPLFIVTGLLWMAFYPLYTLACAAFPRLPVMDSFHRDQVQSVRHRWLNGYKDAQ